MATPLRLFVDAPLAAGATLDLPDAAARHVQVRRAQPGQALRLFDGRGGQWQATVTAMTRSAVSVRVEAHDPVDVGELPVAVTLAVGMPANERMDALVEKATELGAAALQPLVTERSVLRLEGDRAERRRAHWQGVAAAAAEQCGRTRVPRIEPVRPLSAWLPQPPPAAARWVLTPGAARPDASAARVLLAPDLGLTVLSGPEGGLAPGEVRAATDAGFVATGLGPRVLRADSAPLALLAWLGLTL